MMSYSIRAPRKRGTHDSVSFFRAVNHQLLLRERERRPSADPRTGERDRGARTGWRNRGARTGERNGGSGVADRGTR